MLVYMHTTCVYVCVCLSVFLCIIDVHNKLGLYQIKIKNLCIFKNTNIFICVSIILLLYMYIYTYVYITET